MESYLVRDDAALERCDVVERLPDDGFLWLDYLRDEAEAWPERVLQLTGGAVLEQHVTDSRNASHVSYFDATQNYEMVIFQALGPDAVAEQISTRTAAFFLFDNLLVTIHEPDSPSFGIVKERLRQQGARAHTDPVGLAHRILDTMVDRYLALRTPLHERLRQMQDDLLDPKNPFDDYQLMLTRGRRVRKLAELAEMQLEALDAWRRNVLHELSDSQKARLNDLEEHIQRIQRHAASMQAEIEAAVQLHFSATSHRTNEIVQTLTVISAIFLPLTLVAGIFGMNFEHMPELKLRYAYYATLAAMTTLAVVLLAMFRRRGYV